MSDITLLQITISLSTFAVLITIAYYTKNKLRLFGENVYNISVKQDVIIERLDSIIKSISTVIEDIKKLYLECTKEIPQVEYVAEPQIDNTITEEINQQIAEIIEPSKEGNIK